jgi:hypothetical protein
LDRITRLNRITWRLISHFFEGLTPKDSGIDMQIVELICNETLEDKDPDEAMEYLDLLAENVKIRRP